MQTEREIYPNASLQLVAAEVRYPLSPRLASVTPEALLERLGDLLPLIEEEQPMIEVTLGPRGAQPPQAVKGARRLRVLSKARDLSVTISGTNAIVEATSYRRFEEFLDVLTRVFYVVEELGPPVGVERLGLRYIDEIRVPDITDSPGDWHGYVNDVLLSDVDLVQDALGGASLSPQAWQSVVHLAGPEGRGLQVRHGAGLGTAVNPNGPLRFADPAGQRPNYIVDMDSYWAPPEMGDFLPSELVKVSEQLHDPLHGVFERAITDRLRNEVLRKRKEG